MNRSKHYVWVQLNGVPNEPKVHAMAFGEELDVIERTACGRSAPSLKQVGWSYAMPRYLRPDLLTCRKCFPQHGAVHQLLADRLYRR